MGPKKRTTTRSSAAPVGKITATVMASSKKRKVSTKASASRKNRTRRSRTPSPHQQVSNMDISPHASSGETATDKYIIYHENVIGDPTSVSDSYRPIIIIDTPLFSRPGSKTAYYRTSGRSNDKFKGLYANTWFPIGGILENEYSKEDTKFGKGEKMGYGLIIKMSTISHLKYTKSYTWIYDLIIDYYKHITPEEYKEVLRVFQPRREGIKNETDFLIDVRKFLLERSRKYDEVMYFKNLYDEFMELYGLLYNYFLNKNQLCISSIIGGGYWDKNLKFRDYIINSCESSTTELANNAKYLVSTIVVPTEGTTGHNTAEVIEFIKHNNAQYSPDEILENMPTTNLTQYNDSVSILNSQLTGIIALLEREQKAAASKKRGGRRRSTLAPLP